jgi:hypothetical protein
MIYFISEHSNKSQDNISEHSKSQGNKKLNKCLLFEESYLQY